MDLYCYTRVSELGHHSSICLEMACRLLVIRRQAIVLLRGVFALIIPEWTNLSEIWSKATNFN